MERDRVIINKAKERTIHELLGLPRGKRVSIRCPFHNERTPSCVLYPDGSYYCFGCSVHGGDSIDFLTGLGATWSEAIKALTSGI